VRPRTVKLLVAAPLVVGALGFVLVAVLMGAAATSGGVTEAAGAQQQFSSCSVTLTAGTPASSLDADQLANARTIIATGVQMSVPTRGQVVAVATALQESTLRNLPYGDRDSVGLFQQRPSSGWGSVQELTTPSIAARKFYDALLKVPGWIGMPLTVAAQTVQRSAFPLAYAKWEPLAGSIVGGARAEGGLGCASDFEVPVSADGNAGRMLRAALSKQGRPYVWGATGPDSFDCSGLVVWAWRQAGYRLTVRTSEQMYGVSTPVPLGSEQPGDLLFTSFKPSGPGHVLIVVRKGLAVQAPRTGDVVKLSKYTSSSGYVVGRLRRSVLERIPASA
jgi:cell wall-associated NlpC family hydrolase